MSNRLFSLINKLTQWRLSVNFALFRQKYRNSENTKTVLMLLSVILGIVVILQQVKINTMHERLVIVPPNMTKEARIAWKSASQNYLNDTALYIASQISSATPKNVDYIIGAMEGYFHPDIWQSLKPELLAIRDNPNYFGLSNPISQFTPTGGVIFEPETGKTFVIGELRTSAYGKQNKIETLGVSRAVYEMRIATDGGLPKVLEWYVYTGEALTQEYKARKPGDYAKATAERQISPLPMVSDSEIQRESTQNSITMTLTQPQQAEQATQPQVETMQPSVPNVPQEQPVQPVQVAPTQQQVLDPFASAEQQATQNTQQAQAQQTVQPAAPAVILPNGSVPNGLPQPATNTMPASMDDDKL